MREYPYVTAWPVNYGHGSSAMIAVQYALDAWRFDRVVVAGVHLSGPYAGYRPGWTAMVNNHKDRIRAIGGYTEELFGMPDVDFVRSNTSSRPYVSPDGELITTRFSYNRWLSGTCRHRIALPKPNHPIAALVGTSPKMREDVEALKAIGGDVDWVGVNAAPMGIDLPWRHLMSIDPAGMQHFEKYRGAAFIHSVDEPGRIEAGADFLWKTDNRIQRMTGTWGAAICLAMGYRGVVLCGCGMEHTGHHADAPGGDTNRYPSRWQSCHGRDIVRHLGPAIRSMSGLTMRDFKAADAAFLRG